MMLRQLSEDHEPCKPVLFRAFKFVERLFGELMELAAFMDSVGDFFVSLAERKKDLLLGFDVRNELSSENTQPLLAIFPIPLFERFEDRPNALMISEKLLHNIFLHDPTIPLVLGP